MTSCNFISGLRVLLARIGFAIVLLALAIPARGAEPALEYDVRITSTARLLAGLPSDYAPHARFNALESWKEHQAALATAWARIRKARLDVIERWRQQALAEAPKPCSNLLYPFSGPDFLHAHIFFPDCSNYVMFGLETPGELPRLEQLSDRDATKLMYSMRDAMGDMFKRNYFITRKMVRQLRTPQMQGVVPLIVASMALLDLRVTQIEPFDIGAESRGGPRADPGAGPARRIQAVKIGFFQPGINKPQTLYYFSLDATDKALYSNPEFLAFIEKFKPAATFIKSASYLLHGPYFTKVRDTLLEVTDFLVQDDTGIPYRLIRGKGWKVHLYGEYEKPIRDFGKFGLQPDLDAAYRTMKAADRSLLLPFPFGYHWWNGKSNLIVAGPASAPRVVGGTAR